MRRYQLTAAWILVSALAAACGDEDGGDAPADASADGGADAAGDAAPLPRPIAIGAGYNAGVALDTAGTAYIAWVGPESTTTTLQFCRLPRGASMCDARGAIAADGTSLSHPFVIVDGMTVRVLSYRYALTMGDFGAVLLFTSTDGGRTFGAGRRVGTVPFTAAALGPDGTVSLTTHAYQNGTVHQAVPLADGAAAATTEAVLSTTHPYSGAVGFIDGTTPIVVYANGTGDAQTRRYLGTGDRNSAASWSPAQDIGKGDRMHLAGGMRGLFLLLAGDLGLQVRRYQAGVFSPAVSIPEGAGETAHAHMAQDATGRLHVVWPRVEANGFNLYRATSDNGNVWQRRQVTTDEGFVTVRTAFAPDGVGLAVWGTTPSSGSSVIHAVALQRD